MAFDGTYLTPTLSQIQIHERHGLVGGKWSSENKENAFVSLEEDGVDVSGVPRANTMMEFLCWDPSARKKIPLSVCAVPVEQNFGGQNRAQWGILELVGQVLSSSQKVVRGIVFDAHGSHVFVRNIIHGLFEDVPDESLKDIPFFRDLQHISLPSNCLPRLPISICLYKGEAFYAMCVPCTLKEFFTFHILLCSLTCVLFEISTTDLGSISLYKIDMFGSYKMHRPIILEAVFWRLFILLTEVTATRTPSFLRTIQWGKLWTDTTQARSHGLPPVAYARVNVMSDKLNALLCNPFYLVVDADVAMEDMVVPWSLAGFCVHNVVVALCVAPAR